MLRSLQTRVQDAPWIMWIQRHAGSIFGLLAQVIAVARVLFIPIAIALLAAIVLSSPPQIVEYYRILAENLLFEIKERKNLAQAVMQIAVTLFGLLVMATSISYSARVLLIARRRSLPEGSSWNLSYAIIPTLLGMWPLYAVSQGVDASRLSFNTERAKALIDASTPEADPGVIWGFQKAVTYMGDASRLLSFGTDIIGIILCLYFVAGVILYQRARSGMAFYEFTLRPIAPLASLAGLVVNILMVIYWPVAPARVIGAVAIFGLFAACLALLLTQMAVWSDRIDVPIAPIFIAAAAAFAWFDLNDNHDLTRVDSKGQITEEKSRTPPLKDLRQAFKLWYESRPDKGEYQNTKYPVYVVAAQGGGIYAAAQSLQFLMHTQLACERFSQHVFAISGVSGGSVGATLFAAFAENFKGTKDQCAPALGPLPAASATSKFYQGAAYDLTLQDYLSPLFAAAFFPDFAQRFLWYPVPSLSRAHALETAFETSWNDLAATPDAKDRMTAGALGKGILNTWKPDGIAPAVVLNTTETATGRRRIISPFCFGGPVCTPVPEDGALQPTTSSSDLRFVPLSVDSDIPMIAGAVASARFPWLTPAAWFNEKGKQRVVDGGYFENSGIATALDLVESLEQVANGLEVRFHVISLTSGSYANDSYYRMGEFISPVQALFNTRIARQYSTIDLATRKLAVLQNLTDGKNTSPMATDRIGRFHKADFRDLITTLPLGWRLSKASAIQVFYGTGRRQHCHPDDRFQQSANRHIFGSADCVRMLIHHQLRNDNMDEALKPKPTPTPTP